ncbi:MAG: extracellular solute-binding protein [Oliverpabstia sp.]
MKRKAIAMVLCMCLMGGTVLTGCHDSSETTQDVSDSKEKDEESKTENDSDMDTLDVFINMSWYPVDSFTGIIPDLIREKTNVDLNVTIATDSNQLGVMIGSGEIPDLVFTGNDSGELGRLSTGKLCYSYSELEKDYGASFADASDEAKSIASTYSDDGDYYTLLNAFSTDEEWENLKVGAAGQPCLYYRKDIVEQLGNPEIQSVDDLMGVLAQCKEKFPDMTPFGLGGFWKFQALESDMNIYNRQYDPESGEYYYVASAPGYKEFLEKANEMARNGYVTAEAYANENEADGHQAAYNNGCVFYSWYLSYSNYTQLQSESEKINPDAEWGILPYFGNGGIGTSAGWAGCFVSRTCSNPEAAARLLTYLNSTEGKRASMWGREGTDYTLNEEGVPEFSEEYKEARDDGTLNEKYNTMFYFGSSACDEIYMNYSGLDETVVKDFTTYAKNWRNYPEVGMAQPSSSSDEGVIFTKMEELRKSYEAKVIFAESDQEFEDNYEEYMSALKKTGLDDYNDYYTKAIENARELLNK